MEENKSMTTENQNMIEEQTIEENIHGAEQLLQKTTWRTEALQVPLDSVECPNEKAALVKCINMEELSQEESDILQGVLGRYREAIHDLKPDESIENYYENIEYVEDEKAFLDLLDKQDETQQITMYYPLNNGHEAKLDLTVKPITDAQAVINVSENMELFKDYTEDEIQIFTQYSQGEELSPEAQAVAARIESEIAANNANHVRDAAIEFLALQTSFKGKNSSYDDMKAIYNRMNVGYLLLLFSRVRELTHIDDVNVEKIFRDSD